MASDDFPTEAPIHIGAFDRIEQILKSPGADGDVNTLTLGELSDGLEERAFGFLLLILAIPCCLPFVYLLPQIVALPMAVLVGQMAMGRNAPWLPENLRKRALPVKAFLDVLARVKKYGGWVERFSHPRLALLTSDFANRIIGALLLLPCLSILLPLPLTNTVPGIGVAVASVGLIERDGLFVVGGVMIALIWVFALLIGGPTLIYFLIDGILGR